MLYQLVMQLLLLAVQVVRDYNVSGLDAKRSSAITVSKNGIQIKPVMQRELNALQI